MRKIIATQPTTRIKKGFLWFPVTIGEEWRWLEYAIYEEKMYSAAGTHVWEKTRWIDPCSDCNKGIIWDAEVDTNFLCSTCKGQGHLEGLKT